MPRPLYAERIQVILDAIATAPTYDQISFAAHVKRCGHAPAHADLTAALKQAPQFLAENFAEMPADERSERLRLCRLWLDFEESR